MSLHAKWTPRRCLQVLQLVNSGEPRQCTPSRTPPTPCTSAWPGRDWVGRKQLLASPHTPAPSDARRLSTQETGGSHRVNIRKMALPPSEACLPACLSVCRIMRIRCHEICPQVILYFNIYLVVRARLRVHACLPATAHRRRAEVNVQAFHHVSPKDLTRVVALSRKPLCPRSFFHPQKWFLPYGWGQKLNMIGNRPRAKE